MTQQEERRIETPQAGATAEAADGLRRLEDFTEAREEIWDCLQDANRVWLARMQQEAALTAELASKLTASRSLADTTTALQDWTSKHVELTTEDTRRLFTDAQQMVNAGARFWSSSARVPKPETAARLAS
ncbi:MAG: hypothetical protein FJX45_08150 [Alphaproteobacteria bacterium]|nr:hypothetical protein [Alphaproteobacteria bacterium]MBM3652719.1 hypothetical protein [Alphaproteobacteria bacterium]